MLVNSSQDPGGGLDLKSLTFDDAENVVVYVMADYEWGGPQFRVPVAGRNAERHPHGDTALRFEYGGWQQARTVSLNGGIGNRYYMEGSAEFLDSVGEWHFNPATRMLYVAVTDAQAAQAASPPLSQKPGRSRATLPPLDVVLTQTGNLLKLAGSGSGSPERVSNLAFHNLTFTMTSATFFEPHEETSGGDYAVRRSGAILLENTTAISIEHCRLRHIGGNAIFLSNSVEDTVIKANDFSFLGTSGVAIVGKTGAAMMDARDGEWLAAKYGLSADNGVRLPKCGNFDIILGPFLAHSQLHLTPHCPYPAVALLSMLVGSCLVLGI